MQVILFRLVGIRLLILLVICFILGYALRGFKLQPQTGQAVEQLKQPVAQMWTCSMHSNIRQPRSGKCPICFMDLIPVTSTTEELGSRRISFSREAVALMEIETSPVERKFVTTEVRMVGKIDYDETRVKNITTWVPGRIDRLYVDFTGTVVNKGDDHCDCGSCTCSCSYVHRQRFGYYGADGHSFLRRYDNRGSHYACRAGAL